MTKNCCDVEATLALHVHEKGIWRLHKPFQFVLQLFQLCWRVKQVNVIREYHFEPLRDSNAGSNQTSQAAAPNTSTDQKN